MSPPSSRPPSGVPQGGNGKYIIVAVVLLLGIGAIVGARTCLSHPEPEAAAPAKTAAEPPAPPPTNPRLDDIPPPPPPEEVVDAAVQGGPRYVAAPNQGCDSRCTSSYATPDLQAAIAVRGAQARRCYNQALARDSSLKGHVSIAVKIGPTGNVCSANVASNDMASPAVANCAANIFRGATYPAPHGGCVEVNIPIAFVPQGQ